MNFGLIDEHQPLVHQVISGNAKPWVAGINIWLNLNQSETKTFNSGVVGLCYRTDRS
jgi:hypothetical protein